MNFMTKLATNGGKLLLSGGQSAVRPIASAIFPSLSLLNGKDSTPMAPAAAHTPATPSGALLNMVQCREYKAKTRLRKRCRFCEFIWRNGRLYVECKENPRHKQFHMASMLKGFDNIPYGYKQPAAK